MINIPRMNPIEDLSSLVKSRDNDTYDSMTFERSNRLIFWGKKGKSQITKSWITTLIEIWYLRPIRSKLKYSPFHQQRS